MARYCLHNPRSEAHIEDLEGRLVEHLAGAEPTPYDQTNPTALIGTLTEVVRAMDQGVISTPHVQEVFAAFRIPEFSFGRWMAEMVEEGVYLELDRAA